MESAVIIVYSKVGRVEHDSSKRSYAKMSIPDRYRISHLVDAEVKGFVLYRDVSVTDVVQDGSVIGKRGVKWDSTLAIACTSVDLNSRLSEYFPTVVPSIWISLRDALALKSVLFPVDPARTLGALSFPGERASDVLDRSDVVLVNDELSKPLDELRQLRRELTALVDRELEVVSDTKMLLRDVMRRDDVPAPPVVNSMPALTLWMHEHASPDEYVAWISLSMRITSIAHNIRCLRSRRLSLFHSVFAWMVRNKGSAPVENEISQNAQPLWMIRDEIFAASADNKVAKKILPNVDYVIRQIEDELKDHDPTSAMWDDIVARGMEQMFVFLAVVTGEADSLPLELSEPELVRAEGDCDGVESQGLVGDVLSSARASVALVVDGPQQVARILEHVENSSRSAASMFETSERVTKAVENAPKSLMSGLSGGLRAGLESVIPADLIYGEDTTRTLLLDRVSQLAVILLDAWDGTYFWRGMSATAVRRNLMKLASRILTHFGIQTHLIDMLIERVLHCGSSLVDVFLKRYSEAGSGVEAQSLGTDVMDVTGLVALVGTCITKAFPSEVQICQVVRKCSALNSISAAFKNVRTFCDWIVTWLPDCVKQWISVLCPESSWFSLINAGGELRVWYDEVFSVVTPENTVRVAFDEKLQNQILRLGDQGHEYARRLSSETGPISGICHLVFAANKKLETLREAAMVARGRSLNRPVPFCVYLCGDSGVGKSHLTSVLAELLAPAGTPPSQMLYARASGNAFWDGYAQQNAVSIDDFNQFKDSSNLEEFINMMTSTPFFPPLASLDDAGVGKKGTAFNSKVLLLTSNTALPTSNSVSTPKAIYSRRNLVFEVVMNNENDSRGGASGLTPRADEERKAFKDDYSHLSFNHRHAETNAVIAKYDFNGFLRKVLDSYRLYVTAHSRERDNLSRCRSMIASLRHEVDFDSWVRAEGDAASEAPTLGACGQPWCPFSKDHYHKAGVLYIDQHQLQAPFISCLYSVLPAESPKCDKEFLSNHEGWRAYELVATAERGWPTLCEVLSASLKRFANDHPFLMSFCSTLVGGAIGYGVYFTLMRAIRTAMSFLMGYFGDENAEVQGFVNPSPNGGMRLERVRRGRLGARVRAEAATEVTERVLEILPPDRDAKYHWSMVPVWLEHYEAVKNLFGQLFLQANAMGREPPADIMQAADRWLEFLYAVCTTEFPFSNPALYSFYGTCCVDYNMVLDYFRCLDPTVVQTFQACLASWIKQNSAELSKLVPKDRQSELKSLQEYISLIHSVSKVEPQFAIVTDKSTEMLMSGPVRRNLVLLAARSSGYTVRTTAIGLKDTVVLAPLHLFCDTNGDIMAANSEIDVSGSNGVFQRTVSFDPSKLQRLKTSAGDEKDLCVYDLGPAVPAFKSLLPHFLTENDVEYVGLNTFMASLCTMRKGTGEVPMEHTCYNIVAQPMLSAVQYVVGKENPVSFKLAKGWKYDLATEVGFCGSPLLAHSTRMRHKIVGIHVAGKPASSTGYAELITQEMLERAMSFGVRVEGLGTVSGVDVEGVARLFPEGNFTFLGTIDDAPRLAEKTQVRPSLLFDRVWKHTTEPSILSPKDERWTRYGLFGSPLENALAKYGVVVRPFEATTLALALDGLRTLVFDCLRAPAYGVVDLDVAVSGVMLASYMPRLDMTTSPGYPWVTKRPVGEKGKAFLFDITEESVTIKDPALRAVVNAMDVKLREGCRTTSIWTSALKDERRPIAKNQAGKTRAFVVPPVSFTILCRRYFLDFCDAFYAAKLRIPSAVGIDADSLDWHDLWSKMHAKSASGFGGDFSNWDGTMVPEVLAGVVDLISDWYDDGDENRLARNTLREEMVHTVILGLNTVFMKHNGNPSGNPLTVIVNTLCNITYFLYAWLKLAPAELRDPVLFRANVESIFYGDDNACAVVPGVQSFFNMATCSRLFAQHGIVYTPPDKTGMVVEDCVSLDDISFLKRRTTQMGGFYVPLMDENTIHEMVNWITDCDDPLEATEENCANALRFYFFYGREAYKAMRDAIKKGASKIGQPLALPQWDYFNQYFGQRCGLPIMMMSPGSVETVFAQSSVTADTGVLPEIEETRNLGVTTQTQVGVHEEGTVGVVNSKMITTVMSEKRWDVSGLAERPTYVGTYSWTTAQTAGTNIVSYNAPNELWMPSSVNHIPFSIFRYWRGNIVVGIQVNGTRYHSGKLLMYWVPLLPKTRVAQWQGASLTAASACHHIRMDPSVSSARELVIPFQLPTTHMKLSDPLGSFNMGVLGLSVLNPLAVGTGGSNSVDVVITVRFENNQFCVPIPVPIPTPPPPVEGKKMTQRAQQTHKLQRKVDEDGEWVRVEGNVYSVNNNFSHVASATLGQSLTGNELGRGAKAKVSLDKPNNSLEPMAYVRNGMGYSANAQNITALERLAMFPGSISQCRSDHFGTTEDEMSLSYLWSKPTVWKTFDWRAVDPKGTPLITPGHLCPLEDAFDGVWQAGGPSFVPPLRDYVVAPFAMWSGSLVYDLEIVASAFHAGKIFFGVHFGSKDAPTTIDGLTAQYGAYIDLNEGKHHFRFVVPYVANLPAKRIPNCSRANIPNGADELNYHNGRYTITVINQLVAPDGSAQSVQINMWVSCGKDFQVHYLSNHNASIVPDDFLVEVQGEAESDSTMVEETIMAPEMVPTDSTADFGERYLSVQDLLKRFVACGRSTWRLDTSAPYFAQSIINLAWVPVLPRGDPVPPNLVTFGMGCGVFSYYMYLYGAQRGSLRMKITPRGPPNRPMRSSAFYTPDTVLMRDAAGRYNPWATLIPANVSDANALARFLPHEVGAPLASAGAASVIASPAQNITDPEASYHLIEIPFVSEYLFQQNHPYLGSPPIAYETLGRETRGSLCVNSMFVAGDVSSAESSFASMEYYWAAGDEFRFGILLGPPPCKIAFFSTGDPAVRYSFWPDSYGTI